MITSRAIEQVDKALLSESLSHDEYHRNTTADFFYAPGSICNVYEDERGPVLMVRGAKVLRLDIQYLDNSDVRRNMRVMLEGFPDLANKAKQNGFTEMIFNSTSPMLRAFCKRRFGFVESDGELRKFL